MLRDAKATRSSATLGHRFLWILVGVVAGIVVGAVATVGLVGYAVWRTATTDTTTSIPFVVDVVSRSGEIEARSGGGIILPSLIVALLGAGVSAILFEFGASRRRRAP